MYLIQRDIFLVTINVEKLDSVINKIREEH